MITAYFAVIMFVAAINPKVLGASIVAALGLVAAGSDLDKAGMIFALYLPAVVVASFRD